MAPQTRLLSIKNLLEFTSKLDLCPCKLGVKLHHYLCSMRIEIYELQNGKPNQNRLCCSQRFRSESVRYLDVGNTRCQLYLGPYWIMDSFTLYVCVCILCRCQFCSFIINKYLGFIMCSNAIENLYIFPRNFLMKP